MLACCPYKKCQLFCTSDLILAKQKVTSISYILEMHCNNAWLGLHAKCSIHTPLIFTHTYFVTYVSSLNMFVTLAVPEACVMVTGPGNNTHHTDSYNFLVVCVHNNITCLLNKKTS
jgi:hypothetical protein